MRWRTILPIAVVGCGGSSRQPGEVGAAPEAARPSAAIRDAAAIEAAAIEAATVDPRPRIDRPGAWPDPPEGDFTPVEPPPGDPAFQPLPDRWWERKRPCPRGSKLRTVRGRPPHAVAELVHHECVRRGKREGPWVTLYANGRRLEDGWMRGGADHGVRRTFVFDAVDTEETYVDGRRHGWSRQRNRDGSVFTEVPYRDGERHGRFALDSEFGYRAVGWYVDGQRHGVWLGTHADGATLSFRAEVRRGVLDGEQVVWARDGAVLAHAVFRTGDGEWTWWTPDGARHATIRCRGGVLDDFSLDAEPDLEDFERSARARPLASACTPQGEQWMTGNPLENLWPTR
jgi:antitoxin component YwqK of YwqJK toxin-antitoxin module